MTFAILTARLLLACVFGTAGLTKLLDLNGSRRAIANFGVPTWLAKPLGVLLPCAEIAIAICLIITGLFLWGALGSLALLIIFATGMSINLWQGNKPDCHCFGQLHSRPIGIATVIRTCALGGVAAFLMAAGRHRPVLSLLSIPRYISGIQFGAFLAVVLVAVIGQGVLLLLVLRQHGKLLLRIEALESRSHNSSAVALRMEAQPSGEIAKGLAVGSPAPNFQLAESSGEAITLEVLCSWNKPIILIFSDPKCGPCNELLPKVSLWQERYSEALTLVVISRGTLESNCSHVNGGVLQNVLLQRDREVMNSYQSYGTPSAVYIRPDRTVGSLVVNGSQAISNLVDEVVGTFGSSDANWNE